MHEFHRCACGLPFRDWQSFVDHTEGCADWAALEEHEADADEPVETAADCECVR